MADNPFRLVLAIILGFIIGVFINIFFGGFASYLVDIYGDTHYKNPEKLIEGVNSIPLRSWLLTLIGAILGSFLGGLVGVSVDKKKRLLIPILIGICLFIFPGVYIVIVTPAPIWFNALNLFSYLIFSYLGGAYYLLTRTKNN